MAETLKINKRSTMQEVLEAYPSSQRALFRQYHIGGCHSCGYEPTEILEDVVAKHNISDINEVLDFILEADRLDQKMRISPEEVSKALKDGNAPKLIDVRSPKEWEMSHIEGSQLIDEDLAQRIYSWPKDTAIVFLCHTGQRSMDAAAYFAGHGFANVKSLEGGIDAWSRKVDPKVPRYEIARDMTTGRPTLQPLRSVVSQAEGCITP
jgi:rhodanese-related sulfurtransferase